MKKREIDDTFITLSNSSKSKSKASRRISNSDISYTNTSYMKATSNINSKNNVNNDYDKEKEIRNKKAKVRGQKIKRFIGVVLSMIILFMIVSMGAIAVYIKTMVSGNENGNINEILGTTIGQVADAMTVNKRDRVTALVLGTDVSGNLTDVIMLATLDQKTGQVDMVSIPRDTKINLTKEQRDKYNINWSQFKLNAFATYSSVDDLRAYLEDWLNVSIDYYAKVDTKAFVKIVDEIGGVEYDVPQNMSHYDPGNLVISLKKGKQVLNGKQAEGLVRMRKVYAGDGDFVRMQVQQNFLKEAFKQIMAKVTPENLPSLALSIYQYIDTDFGITDIPEGISKALKVDQNNINMHNLPAQSRTIVEKLYVNGELTDVPVSYVLVDEIAAMDLVDEIWYPEKFEEEMEEIKWKAY